MKGIRELVPDVEDLGGDYRDECGGSVYLIDDVKAQTDKLRKAVEAIESGIKVLNRMGIHHPKSLIDAYEQLTGEKWEEIDG